MSVNKMIYISLALGSAIFIAILIRLAVKSKDFSACVSQVLIGVWLMEIVLILPIFLKTYSVVPALISSFLYGLKCLAGRQSIDLIFESGLNGAPRLLYHSLHYIAFVAAPVVTSSLIISFFGDVSDRIRYWLTFRTRCHVFSELNDEAISLAESITSKKEKSVVVFCNTKNTDNVQKKQARDIGAILLHTTSDKFKILRRYHEISFYQINRDEDENIKNSLLLIEQYREIDFKGNKGIMIFAFISSYTKTQLLESVDYGHLKVHIVNVALLTCYNQLKKETLYQNCRENNIVSALIVGAGDTGLEFLKAICWCGQILDCGLEINVFDKDAVKIEKEFFAACPELHFDEYAVRFVSSDATCTDFEEKLNAYCKKTSYAVLSMTDDDLNIDTALYLRGYFLRSNLEAVRYPIINARVRNTMKNKHLLSRDNFISSRNIILFGCLDDTYAIDNILDSKIEQMAISIHCYYSLPDNVKPEDKDKAKKDYYSKEYNRRSSMANALHIQYKLFSCEVMSADENKLTFKHSEEFHSLISANAEVKTRLAKLEHQRWNAFMRGIGYRSIEASKIHYYTQYGQKKSYINTVALLHPCLVEWDELENVSKVVSEATGCPVDFVKADYTMVEAVPVIINQILKDEDEKQIEGEGV